jgi:murein L,D-transpeptidase YcbB/YkuD
VHRVIVGKRRTPTPQFAAMVSGVILNPEWVVPKSIQDEGIARMLVTNPRAAAARGYRRTETGITQGPGPYNQLGQVKLRMPNPWSVYLHDTPAKALFTRKDRALSHGCVRTQDILGLAERLLAGTPGWSRAALDHAVAAGKTRDITLSAPVPVYLLYFTAEPDEAGGIRFHPDLYGRDALILAALASSRAASSAEPPRDQEASGAERGEDVAELVGRKGEAAVAAADLAL